MGSLATTTVKAEPSRTTMDGATSTRTSSKLLPWSFVLSWGIWCVAMSLEAGDLANRLVIDAPVPYQVIQRQGYPAVAPRAEGNGSPIEATPLGTADLRGAAVVVIRWHLAKSKADESTEQPSAANAPLARDATICWESRLVSTVGDTAVPADQGDWHVLNARPGLTANDSLAVPSPNSATSQAHGRDWYANVLIPAGGWYRIELRGSAEQVTPFEAAVEPVGVGEVFVVAGQSYATNWNDEILTVRDPQQRVAAATLGQTAWRVANDPQPVVDGSDGGSIWPVVGDELTAAWDVPIGFLNVAVGATSTTSWRPEGDLHARLIAAGQQLGHFRAVLWQQGESDVLEGTHTAEYVRRVTAIRNAAEQAWQQDVPWLLAMSTHHPTVYNDPVGEGRIRSAVTQLLAQPGFLPGPDTDTLQREHRGPLGTRRHFSGVGQQAAGRMWMESVKTAFSVPTNK